MTQSCISEIAAVHTDCKNDAQIVELEIAANLHRTARMMQRDAAHIVELEIAANSHRFAKMI